MNLADESVKTNPVAKHTEYKAIKEKDFRPTSEKRKRKHNVKINIGVMFYDDIAAKLRQQRRKGMQVTLKKNFSKDDLLDVALEKHLAHSKD